MVFAISQAALRYGLTREMHAALTTPGGELSRNKHEALLEPSIYRNIEISDMYLVEDILDTMLVPPVEVPPFEPTAKNKAAFKVAYQSTATTGSSRSGSIFKAERKSDFATGFYVASVKKVRCSS